MSFGDIEIKNAVIKSARISIEDHGFLTIFLDLDYGGTGQGFGGYNLGTCSSIATTGHCANWIMGILKVADVTEWKDVVGKTVRVRASYNKTYAIGHIIKDIWFDPEILPE